ncbi:MAG: hypothetical protein WCJ71_03950, partial [Candidatus Omnitrophota bacterium]
HPLLHELMSVDGLSLHVHGEKFATTRDGLEEFTEQLGLANTRGSNNSNILTIAILNIIDALFQTHLNGFSHQKRHDLNSRH